MQKIIRIILTGGGSGGHVYPNIALYENLVNQNLIQKNHILYIGSNNGIEQKILSKTKINTKYIYAGKLRRYFSIYNFTDIFKTFIGFFQSLYYMIKFKPNIIFSKGGFVSIPVCFAGKLLGKKIIIHESDQIAGLSNKIIGKIANKKLSAFQMKGFEYVGMPIRSKFFDINKNTAKKFFSFKNKEKPILLIFGGSLGAKFINNIVYENLDKLIKKFNIIHITGENYYQNIKKEGYKYYLFLKEIHYAYFISDIIISRAGATSIFEIIHFKKPSIIIPLEKNASRGEQLLNCNIIKENNIGIILKEKDYNSKYFLDIIHKVYINKKIYKNNFNKNFNINSTEKIYNIISNL